jgi:hypothetical protein
MGEKKANSCSTAVQPRPRRGQGRVTLEGGLLGGSRTNAWRTRGDTIVQPTTSFAPDSLSRLSFEERTNPLGLGDIGWWFITAPRTGSQHYCSPAVGDGGVDQSAMAPVLCREAG